MFKQESVFCKIVLIVAIIGALNWGLVGVANFNIVDHIFGLGSMAARVVYILVGLSGVAILTGFFKNCPMCKKQ